MKKILKNLGLTLMSMTLLLSRVNDLMGGTIAVHSENQGWVNSLGEGNGAGNGNNTITGNEFENRYNSWASFSIPNWGGLITSATLEIPLTPVDSGIPAIYTIGIYDVSTPFTSFADMTAGIPGYTDLRTGNLYGTVDGFDGLVSVVLSSQALADLNAAKGGIFILGFTNITLNGVPSLPSDDIGVYPNGGGSSGEPTLLLAVPEPSSFALMAIGGFATTMIAIRRRTVAV